MKVIETRENMLKIIRSVHAGDLSLEEYLELICDKLMEAGAFVPPVNIGGVVWAALPSILGEEACVEPWAVCGYGVELGGDIFFEARDHEQYLVGDMYCKLTKEEAEEYLRDNGREGS